MKPDITIIVITYNTPDYYLEKCIESIVNQTYKNIEILVVDDGSKNDVKEIVNKFKDERIKLIRQENQGESVARNVGIKNALTNNIIFVDSDDYVKKDMCQKVHNCLLEIKDYEIIIFNCYVDFEKQSVKNKFYTENGWLNESDIKEIELQNIEKGIVKYYPPKTNISVVWAKVYNKEFILKNNLKFIPNVIRMPDALFNMEAFEKASKIYILDEYLYHYQQNQFSICNRFSKDTVDYYEKYIKYVQEYIKKYNKDEDFVDTLNLKIVTSIDIYMGNYYFNKNNPKNKKEIEKEFKGLLDKDLYVNAFKNVKKEYLSTYQKLVLKYSANKDINKLRILRIIKKFLRRTNKIMKYTKNKNEKTR